MERISLADAEGCLADIIDQAKSSGPVTITFEGQPVAVVSGIELLRGLNNGIDVDALRALTARMTPSKTSAVEIVREMRDSRY